MDDQSIKPHSVDVLEVVSSFDSASFNSISPTLNGFAHMVAKYGGWCDN